MHCRSCVFLDVLKLQSEGMKGVAWGFASRWWGTMVATPCSRRQSCRSLLLCSFLNWTFIHSLWTSFIWKERCRVAPGPWSPSPPSCRWSRPWGTQWSRGSIPTLPSPRTLLWRNEPWTEGAWLENGLSEFGDLLVSGEIALDEMWPKHGCVFVHNYAYFVTLVDLDIYIVLRWKGRNLCDKNMQGDKTMQVIKESIMENKFCYVA